MDDINTWEGEEGEEREGFSYRIGWRDGVRNQLPTQESLGMRLGAEEIVLTMAHLVKMLEVSVYQLEGHS